MPSVFDARPILNPNLTPIPALALTQSFACRLGAPIRHSHHLQGQLRRGTVRVRIRFRIRERVRVMITVTVRVKVTVTVGVRVMVRVRVRVRLDQF